MAFLTYDEVKARLHKYTNKPGRYVIQSSALYNLVEKIFLKDNSNIQNQCVS